MPDESPPEVTPAQLVGDTYTVACQLVEALSYAYSAWGSDPANFDPELRAKATEESKRRVLQWTPLLRDLLKHTRARFAEVSAFGSEPIGGMTHASAHAFVLYVGSEVDWYLREDGQLLRLLTVFEETQEVRDRVAGIQGNLECEYHRAMARLRERGEADGLGGARRRKLILDSKDGSIRWNDGGEPASATDGIKIICALHWSRGKALSSMAINQGFTNRGIETVADIPGVVRRFRKSFPAIAEVIKSDSRNAYKGYWLDPSVDIEILGPWSTIR